MPGQSQDPSFSSPPSTANSRSGTAGGAAPAPASAAPTAYTPDGAPIVPVGISGGKMFRCRGFGDCDKVFTRSEHLARHVRKHTGERPFPCHCGKAFSRLDNLRQHAATVHADQTQLNEAMLASLASVHAALSQRANREQRRRGEVVEVPKNAVERPRGERNKTSQPGGVPPPANNTPYPPGAPGYHQQPWGAPPLHDGRPRTAGGGWMEYPYPGQPGLEHPPPGTAGSGGYPEDAGPSRRPPSSAGSYPPPAHGDYYQQGPPGSAHGRPPTAGPAPGTSGSDESQSQVPYPPYRPMSSNGREAGPPGHYADSEPPTSAHGPPPPHSPMYPYPNAGGLPPPGQWQSPGTPHSEYAQTTDPNLYPQNPASVGPDGQHYPHDGGNHYGPPPPGSSGSYHYPSGQGAQPGYYGQQSPAQQHAGTFANQPAPPGSAGGPPGSAGSYTAGYNGPPGESPFQYNAPGTYPYPGYDGRKRRAEDDPSEDRSKHPRNSTEGGGGGGGSGPAGEPRAPGTLGSAQGQEAAAQGENPLWLPPATERRQSLAISALLGSPQNEARTSRPPTGDASSQQQQQSQQLQYPYPGAPDVRDREHDDKKPVPA